MKTYKRVRFIIKVSKRNNETFFAMEDMYWDSFYVAGLQGGKLVSGAYQADIAIEEALALCKKSAKNMKEGIWGVEVNGYPFGKTAKLVPWNYQLPNRAW